MSYNNVKIDEVREINFDVYKSFFLEYYTKSSLSHCCYHILRPCELSYDEIKDSKSFILDSAVMMFDISMSLQEIFIQCAIRGIHIDFVDMYEYDKEKNDNRLIRYIDCYKNEISEIITEVNSPRFYTVKNNDDKQKNFRFLVIDRFKQDANIRFVNGEYDVNAIIGGFKTRKDAEEFCFRKNDII